MALYPYVATLAVNPQTLEKAAGATGVIYAPEDTNFASPLTATDETGNPIPLTSNNDGVLPSFYSTAPAVNWRAGSYVFPLVTSMPLPGPQGAPGDPGRDGQDGSNVVPTAEAIAAEIQTPGTPANTALSETIAERTVIDRGNAFVAKLDAGLQNVDLAITSDSTGAFDTHWPVKLTKHLASKYPGYKVVFKHWLDSSKSMVSSVIQGGRPNRELATLVEERFDRVATDINGTIPTVGVGPYHYNVGAGNWELNGTAAIAKTAATYGRVFAHVEQGGESVVRYTYKANSVPATSAQMRFYSKSGLYLTDSIVQLSLTRTASDWSAILTRVINGTPIQMATKTGNTLPADGIYQVQIHYKPKGATPASVTATINGATLTGTVPDADDAILAPYTRHGFGAISADTAGDEMRLFQVRAPETNGVPPTLTVHNGAMPGANLAYHTTWFDTMFPVKPDAMIISMGHNYNNVEPAAFLTIYEAYVAKVRAAFPGTGIIVSSQNPESAPRQVAGRQLHADRDAALAAYAGARGYGFVPVLAEFARRRNDWASLITTDGVHPSDAGDTVWANVAIAYFDGLSYTTGPALQLRDTFDRTEKSLVGTTVPYGGGTWVGQASADCWSVFNGSAIAKTAGAYLRTTVDTGQVGKTITRFTYKANAVPATSASLRFVVHSDEPTGSDRVEVRLTRTPTAFTFTLNKTVSGAGAVLGTSASNPVPADGLYSIEITYQPKSAGVAASATVRINGVTLTASLTDSDDARLSVGQSHGIWAIDAATVGDEIQHFEVLA